MCIKFKNLCGNFCKKGEKMNYTKTLDYIHSLGNFSKAPSLERIKQVLKKLNSPQKDL